MPNLQQLANLKKLYGDSALSLLRQKDAELLLESFDPARIEKGFNINGLGKGTRHFSFPEFRVEDYISFFLKRQKAEVVLLFIDITSFSRKFLYQTPDQLVDYLDAYYQKVIPIINNHGGEIEKIMGDGIICVFGKPFLDDDELSLHKWAESCARELISELKHTEFAVKVALHFGEIMYYQNPSNIYYEYTMIGNSITELFRLESKSKPNSISFFEGSKFHKIQDFKVHDHERQILLKSVKPAAWVLKNGGPLNLQGIRPDQNFMYIEYEG